MLEKNPKSIYAVSLLIMHHLVEINKENLSLDEISNYFEFIDIDESIST